MSLHGGRTRQRRREAARRWVENRLNGPHQELVEILRDAEQELTWAPPRSTFYEWVGDWKARRSRDQSGPWSLGEDTTGRPDIVMSVLAALAGAAGGTPGPITYPEAKAIVRLGSAFEPITNGEARWLVRLAIAVPDILVDGDAWDLSAYSMKEAVSGSVLGAIRLHRWALRYVDAETAGDTELLRDLDTTVAALYASGGRQRDTAFGVTWDESKKKG